MESTNYAQILSERILALRKEKGMTQEALAQQLGVSFQAVSKWENGQSCPDIALLPLLADVYGVPVDGLFGREAKAEPEQPAPEAPAVEPVFSYCEALPWPDDLTLRGVIAVGHKILSHDYVQPKKRFALDVKRSEYTWLLRYSPLNVAAECNLHVEGDIQGGANAGGSIDCGDVGGTANAGSHINCRDIGGTANAGTHISCGDIQGNANAGTRIDGGDIGGSASAGLSIECASIGGDAKATKISFKGKK
jgi:transcriptional regulator with XRE-family HTH domain